MTQLAPHFKIFISLPSFPFHPFLGYFRQFVPPSRNTLLPQSNQPTFLSLSKYEKGDFASSTVTFYQKSIFKLLNPFTNRLS